MKIVLVSQRIDYLSDRNETRDSIDQSLISFLNKAGFKAFPLPNVNDNQEKFIEEILFKLNPVGIVLSGGNNIGDYSNRDNLEYELIKKSLYKKIPLIGICRGMQIINKFFGGDLKLIKNHVNTRHFVKNADFKLNVNSFHNYAINNKSNQLISFLVADDGSIESFKHVNNFIIGIMWHPEREKNFKKFDIDLFKSFFK